ncbi:MAG: hypothetical protein KF836_08315 [Fimbriimonadaceae bacterium]|nr:hypothetical protein [Fimbriimonadaceae bacterium]
MKHNKRNDIVTIDLNPIWPKVGRFQWWINRDGYELVTDPGEYYYSIRRKQLGKFGWRLYVESFPGDDLNTSYLADISEEDDVFESGSEEDYPYTAAIKAVNFDFFDDVIEGDGKPTGCFDLHIEDFPGLYRDFAAMPRTQKGVLQFASRFGFLGVNTLGFVSNREGFAGEYIADWIAEAHKMDLLLRLWDQIQSNSFSLESTVPPIAYYDTGISFIHGDNYIKEIARSNFLSDEFDYPRKDIGKMDDQTRAREEAKDQDQSFKEHMQVVSQNTLHYHLIETIRTVCYPDFEFKKGAHIRLTPESLLGAMYLQFLNEVIGMPDPINRCPVCGTHFKAENSAKKFCSDKCKMKAFRRSKKEKENGR